MTQENEERKKIEVKINRRKYTIVGTESKEHMELVAKLVNDKMMEIYENNKHLDTTKLAVLTAINTMNDYLKLKADYEDLETLIEEEN
ncbi:cell division protein ZapA [Pseudogracilibacillus sp. SE30717A]|uniref:cell division protein ZapA n=1 Tax=Pseudogracilibacillus sp. SE30717A TaxID=3098293 RepID=UPI00300DF350